MSSSEVAAAASRVEVIDLTSEDRGPKTLTTAAAASTRSSASGLYASTLAPSIQTLTSRRSLHSTSTPKKASVPPSMKTFTQPPSSTTYMKPKPSISVEKTSISTSNANISAVKSAKSCITASTTSLIQNGPTSNMTTSSTASKGSTQVPSSTSALSGMKSQPTKPASSSTKTFPLPQASTQQVASSAIVRPLPAFSSRKAASSTNFSGLKFIPRKSSEPSTITKPVPVALPTSSSLSGQSSSSSLEPSSVTKPLPVSSSKKATSSSSLKSLPSSTSRKSSEPSAIARPLPVASSKHMSSSQSGLKPLPSSSQPATIAIPHKENSALQAPVCVSWGNPSTSTTSHSGPAEAAPSPRHNPPLPLNPSPAETAPPPHHLPPHQSANAAPPPRHHPPPAKAAPPPHHLPPHQSADAAPPPSRLPPCQAAPPPSHSLPPATAPPPHSEIKPLSISPPLDSEPSGIKSFSPPPSSPLSPNSPKYTLVPSPEPIMSPKVFELSPPKNESNWTSQSHHPSQLRGEFDEERRLEQNLKRCRDFCSDEDHPDSKRLRRTDSSDSVSSSILDHDIESVGSAVEKDEAALTSGNRKIPSKGPKKAKKFAGQRRVRKKIPKSSSELGTISFECSLEVMQKLEELFHQMCPPPATTTEEDSPDGDEKKAKAKKSRFSRCPSDKKYLCEVCSKSDCKKCSNCLNRSTRRQSCKEKPKEKCLTWIRKQREMKEKKEKEEEQRRLSSQSGEMEKRSRSVSREAAVDEQSRDGDTSRDGGASRDGGTNGLASYPVATPEQIAIASGFKGFLNGTSVSPLFEDNAENIPSDQTTSFLHVKKEVADEPCIPTKPDLSIVDPDQTTSFAHVKEELGMSIVDQDQTTTFVHVKKELGTSIVDPDQTTSFVHVKKELDVSIVDPDQTTSFVHVKDEVIDIDEPHIPTDLDVSIISSHPAKTPFPTLPNGIYDDPPQPGTVTETVLESNQNMASDGEESVFDSNSSMCASPVSPSLAPHECMSPASPGQALHECMSPASHGQTPHEWSELQSFELDDAIDCGLYSPALSDSSATYHPSQTESQDFKNKAGISPLCLANSNAEGEGNDSKEFRSPSMLSSGAHSAPRGPPSHGAEIDLTFPCDLPEATTQLPASPKSPLTPHQYTPASQQPTSFPSSGLTEYTILLSETSSALPPAHPTHDQKPASAPPTLREEDIQPSRSYSAPMADTEMVFGIGQKMDLIPLQAIQKHHASHSNPAETSGLQLNAGTTLANMRRRTSTPPSPVPTPGLQPSAGMSLESTAARGASQSAVEPNFVFGRRSSSVSLADESRQNFLPSPLQAVQQSDLIVSQPACLPHAARSPSGRSGGLVSSPCQPISANLPVQAGIANEDSLSSEATSLSSQQPSQQSQTQISEAGISLDQAVEDILDKGLEEGIVQLHITKCGVSGPPETGKSHVRALMLGQPRPLTRHSTAVATEADQATPDFQKLYDKSEYVIDMDGKGCVWRVLKDDSMARIIANTLFTKYQKDVGFCNVNPDLQTPPQSREHIRDKYKIILNVKKRLRCMIGKKGRKKKGLNGIRLVYFVDTGGQPQFQEILPNFIKCDVNLLVHKLSQELLERPDFNFVTNGKKFSVPERMKLSNIDIIEQSVRSITSNARPYAKPSVAIVGTFKDKCDPLTYEDRLKEKSKIINERLKPYLSGRGKCELFSPKHTTEQRIFAIDGSLEGWNSNIDTLDKLKHFIDEHAAKKSIDVPVKYYIFIEILKAHGQQYLTLQKCEEIAHTLGISMTQAEIVKALELFDECNVILYFPKVLKDIAFIKPGFLFNLVTELIVASFKCESDPLSQERLYFQQTGIFSRSILQDIPSLQKLSGPFTQQDFLNLMENLYIIAPTSQTGCYFMPCVLPLENSSTVSRELADVKECMKDGRIDGPLVISFAHKISPRGLFCAILVALVKNSSWKLSTLSEGIYRRRNLVEFEVFHRLGRHSGCSGKVVIFDKGSKLEIYTTCDRDTCSSIRQTIYSAFEEASESLGYDKVFDSVGLPCNNCPKSVDEHCTDVYAKDDGIWKEKCLVNTRKHPVTLTSNRLIWFREDLHRAGGEELFRVFCNEVVPHTNKWKAIGINLSLDIQRIDRIERDFDRTEDCFLEVLKTWRRNGTPAFNVSTMVSVLEEDSVEEICLAKSLHDKYCV